MNEVGVVLDGEKRIILVVSDSSYLTKFLLTFYWWAFECTRNGDEALFDDWSRPHSSSTEFQESDF